MPSSLAADKFYGQKAKTTSSTKECEPIILSTMSPTDEVNRATSPLREDIRILKQWIAEENEDPQGPFSKNKKIEEMSPSELEQERDFLESRLRSIYTEKLIVNNRWEMGMEDFRLYALRNKASGLLSTGFTTGDGPSSEEVTRKRLNR